MIEKQLTPIFLDVFLESCDGQLDLNELENIFVKIDEQNFRFSKFIALLMETKTWQASVNQNPCYKDLCYNLALEPLAKSIKANGINGLKGKKENSPAIK